MSEQPRATSPQALIEGRVGQEAVQWATAPSAGKASLRNADGSLTEVRYRIDPHGIWIELPHGVFGYDIAGQLSDEGFPQFAISRRGTDEAWINQSYTRLGNEVSSSAASGKKKAIRVRAQMPGKIIRILAQQGCEVKKDEPLLVMEAMKMENEIRAPQSGKLSQVKVTEGQAVETGADLMVLE